MSSSSSSTVSSVSSTTSSNAASAFSSSFFNSAPPNFNFFSAPEPPTSTSTTTSTTTTTSPAASTSYPANPFGDMFSPQSMNDWIANIFGGNAGSSSFPPATQQQHTASSCNGNSSTSIHTSSSSSYSFSSSTVTAHASGSTATAAARDDARTGPRPSFCLKRLEKERRDLLQRPPENIRLNEPSDGFEWLVNIKGAEGTLYADEEFQLRFKFPERYPLDSPEVMFVGTAPIHPHIYSNGHICLSILYDGWSPALSVVSICLSLISMLSSCKRKESPIDNAAYVRMAGPLVSPKHMRWIFHDDSV